MATKQALYTGALTALGDRKYLTTEQATAINVLDDVYAQVLAECLEECSWNFATTFIKLDGDSGLLNFATGSASDTGTIGHGYRYGFSKPDGWVRTYAVSGDEYFAYPLREYVDEDAVLKSDTTPIYMRYTDTGPGLNLNRWPASFTRYVELALADRVASRLTQESNVIKEIRERLDKARTRAKNKDAMDETSAKFKPPGSWTRSRWGQSGRDLGSRNKLTG